MDASTMTRPPRKTDIMTKLAKILVIPVQKRERPTAPPPIDHQSRDRRARWLLAPILVGALGLFWLGAFLSRSQEVAGLRSLSVEARRGLVVRIVDELESICRSPAAASGRLRAHCVEQAHFVLLIPECTETCQRTAAGTLPHAGR